MPIIVKTIMVSNIDELRIFLLDIMSRLIESAAASAVQPLVPDLVPTLLESLSGLENVKLNYVEQHAESIGLDKDKMESLRISAATSTPMWKTLDTCLKYKIRLKLKLN